jgi:virginiamycin B lyase
VSRTASSAGPDGALWITDFLGAIDRMTTAGTVTNRYLIGSSEPDIIVLGPDGALWYTLSFQYAIGHITTAGTNTFDPTPVTGGRSYSNGIAVGGDGALWFALNASAIGRITTGGVVNECPTPTAPVGGTSLPFGMTAGPDAAMWFTENKAGKIGRIPLSSVTADGRQRLHR